MKIFNFNKKEKILFVILTVIFTIVFGILAVTEGIGRRGVSYLYESESGPILGDGVDFNPFFWAGLIVGEPFDFLGVLLWWVILGIIFSRISISIYRKWFKKIEKH